MSRVIMLVLIVALCGCSYGGDQFKSLVADPHFAQYKEKLDDLEHNRLAGTISYSEYVEKKKELDDTYAKEVEERENVIHGQ